MNHVEVYLLGLIAALLAGLSVRWSQLHAEHLREETRTREHLARLEREMIQERINNLVERNEQDKEYRIKLHDLMDAVRPNPDKQEE